MKARSWEYGSSKERRRIFWRSSSGSDMKDMGIFDAAVLVTAIELVDVDEEG